MSRNLVVCFDGTNNQFGSENTNVVRLVQSLLRDPAKQWLYYDPGVGTMPEPGVFTKLGKRLSEVWGLAFGAGFTGKVEEAYTWLMDSFEPGDQVFLFGFSRGAYSARVLAGLLHALGLMPRGAHNMVPYAMKLYRAIRDQAAAPDQGASAPATPDGSDYWKLCDAFRWTFAKSLAPGDDDRRFPTHFLGVWDTVSSLGWVWDPPRFPFTAHNPSVQIARHAMAIDERRAFYRQNRLGTLPDQDVQERWFPGVHSDVGGGYPYVFSQPPPVYSLLWQRPFTWILQEARAAGLYIDEGRLKKVLADCPTSTCDWKDPLHQSLTPLWWPIEYFPKLQHVPGTSFRRPYLNRGRPRIILPGELIDGWALRRIHDTAYDPPNLSQGFRDRVRAMPTDQIPDCLAYEP